MTGFEIDGLAWVTGCKEMRVMLITESDASGMMLDGTYLSDPLGTWIQYDVTMACPFGKEDLYNTIHDLLSKPVKEHTFRFPYRDSSVTFKGRVTSGPRDNLFQVQGNNYWEGCSFTVVSNKAVTVPTSGGSSS